MPFSKVIYSLMFLYGINNAKSQDYISKLMVEQIDNKIYIAYVLDALNPNEYYEVSVKVKSSVAGWIPAYYGFSGDIGKVNSGGEKEIIWDVLADVPKLGGDMSFDIEAVLYRSENNKDIEYFTDSRDGEVYKTVKIGDQVWMAENLRYNAEGSYLNPDNPSKEYGRLYDWATVMDIDKKYNKKRWGGSGDGHQGICPRGWHLPTDEEWKEMEISLGLSSEEANKEGKRGSHGARMKSVTGLGKSGNGTNSSGFNAVSSGFYFFGSFYNFGYSSHFWSATEYDAPDTWYRFLNLGNTGVYHNYTNKTFSFSCRCLQD